MKLHLALAASLSAAVLPATAFAQQAWLSDGRIANGVGIRVGDLVLHPGVAAEAGYDSNFFQRAGNGDPAEEVEAVYRVRVVPNLQLSTQAGTQLSFAATAFAAYDRIFAADSDAKDEVNRGLLQLGVGLNGNAFQRSQFGFDFNGGALRIAEPSNSPLDDLAWDRWAFRGGAGISWRPGGGLFTWRVGYDIAYNHFEEDAFKVYNNLQHIIGMQGNWRFLPRTSLLYDGSYTLVRYTRDADTTPADGEILRSRIGIRGLVTYRLALTGMIGWMSSFYHNVRQNQDTITALAEVKYNLISGPSEDNVSASTGLSSIAVGYTRDMSNSYVNSFYTRDRGYLTFNFLLANGFSTALEGGVSWLHYPNDETYESFDQVRVDARLFAQYAFTQMFAVTGTLGYYLNASDQLVFRDPDDGTPEDLDFNRFQGFLGLRWFM